jgi:hypothetical protein
MKNNVNFILVLLLATLLFQYHAVAQQKEWKGKFEQLGEMLPTPNEYRASDGAPGPKYWQQKADYKIKVKLDDENQKITGSETVIYHNNSPQTLSYIWLQLDQNHRQPQNDDELTKTYSIKESRSHDTRFFSIGMGLRTTINGCNITQLTDANGNALEVMINKTMMRINLPKPLKSNESFELKINWWYNINDRMEDYGRSGYEYFPKDDNYVYTIAQFYPRMAVYDDYEGWQNKQFLGRGEFALTFGDYEVEIEVPEDHLVAATGELQNSKQVLSKNQIRQFEKAKKSFNRPVIIASQEEAEQREKSKKTSYKTWVFKAKNVRDFAFASSRKFIWDAQAVKIGDKTPLAMSFYPKEGNPLWEIESTKAVVNTLETYSKYTIDYPYPVATSVHAADIGMEYPMICFNFGRPREDGTYNDAIKYRMIGVVIHEVGHNFFPMIVNSDERQWTWMDEGLNSFLQFRTEQEKYKNFPSRRGPATKIIPYMAGNVENMRPLMTNPEQISQLGNNAYGKPAAALNILRETIMKPELFDFAFKTYAQRWAFKHPKPADFFRTMEDASAIDLDWFWRGWFYTNEYVDISIDSIRWYKIGKPSAVQGDEMDIFKNPSYFELNPSADNYYGEFKGRMDSEKFIEEMKGNEFYEISFSNKGGLVMPLLLDFEFEDGSTQHIEIPVEVWRKNENRFSKLFFFDKKVVSMRLDKNRETADVDTQNNSFPRENKTSEFDNFKKKIKD